MPHTRASPCKYEHNILSGIAISRLEMIAQNDFGVTKLSFLLYIMLSEACA